MLSYREFIEGYESPESSGDDQAIIDTDIEERLKNKRKKAKLFKEEEQSDFQQESKQKRISVAEGYPGEGKSYKVLSQIDLSMFEADIREGELTKPQLCAKYRVSRSTVNRYINNFRAYGYVKYKKQINSHYPGELIKKLLNQNQELSRRISKEKEKQKQKDEQFYGTISRQKQKQHLKLF